ncbi:MAG: CBS domain-containing protein [candidate division Zixibacteria bacterium]|nr:CBS domain-containing protein [candidate division Zixibacteria bacterium]
MPERIKHIRAGDVMIPLDQYPHIPYWISLRQAMVEMEKSELVVQGRVSLPRVVLVFDEEYQLMGTVRRRDIMRGLEPPILRERPIDDRKRMFSAEHADRLEGLSYEEILAGVLKQAETSVGDVMQPIEHTVDYHDHLFKVVYEMNTHDLSLLPVLRDGQVAGVIRSVDVFREITRILL